MILLSKRLESSLKLETTNTFAFLYSARSELLSLEALTALLRLLGSLDFTYVGKVNMSYQESSPAAVSIR